MKVLNPRARLKPMKVRSRTLAQFINDFVPDDMREEISRIYGREVQDFFTNLNLIYQAEPHRLRSIHAGVKAFLVGVLTEIIAYVELKDLDFDEIFGIAQQISGKVDILCGPNIVRIPLPGEKTVALEEVDLFRQKKLSDFEVGIWMEDGIFLRLAGVEVKPHPGYRKAAEEQLIRLDEDYYHKGGQILHKDRPHSPITVLFSPLLEHWIMTPASRHSERSFKKGGNKRIFSLLADADLISDLAHELAHEMLSSIETASKKAIALSSEISPVWFFWLNKNVKDRLGRPNKPRQNRIEKAMNSSLWRTYLKIKRRGIHAQEHAQSEDISAEADSEHAETQRRRFFYYRYRENLENLALAQGLNRVLQFLPSLRDILGPLDVIAQPEAAGRMPFPIESDFSDLLIGRFHADQSAGKGLDGFFDLYATVDINLENFPNALDRVKERLVKQDEYFQSGAPLVYPMVSKRRKRYRVRWGVWDEMFFSRTPGEEEPIHSLTSPGHWFMTVNTRVNQTYVQSLGMELVHLGTTKRQLAPVAESLTRDMFAPYPEFELCKFKHPDQY